MEEENIKIWGKSNWTFQAHQIIDAIAKFPEDSNLSIIMRHSHRIDTDDMQKMANLGLTDLGKDIAEIFGCKLPLNRSIRLYYSTASRCEETALSILRGFQTIGGSGEIFGSFEPLYSFGKDSDFVLKNAYKYPGARFINRWAAGLFSEKYIKNFIKYCIQSALDIWNQAKISNSINIYVTHDLVVMALKYGWFGITPGKNWVNFLGGFLMTVMKDRILLFDEDKCDIHEIPYWFKDPKSFLIKESK